jgi:hypothetical protein
MSDPSVETDGCAVPAVRRAVDSATIMIIVLRSVIMAILFKELGGFAS